jgi:hypothetical protein
MSPPNQKALHKAAKSKGRKQSASGKPAKRKGRKQSASGKPAKRKGHNQTASGKAAKPTSYKIKPFPKGMILENDDEDGANSNVKRSLFGRLPEIYEGITGKQLAKLTDQQVRDLIPATETSKIDPFQNNADLEANRLMVRPESK